MSLASQNGPPQFWTSLGFHLLPGPTALTTALSLWMDATFLLLRGTSNSAILLTSLYAFSELCFTARNADFLGKRPMGVIWEEGELRSSALVGHLLYTRKIHTETLIHITLLPLKELRSTYFFLAGHFCLSKKLFLFPSFPEILSSWYRILVCFCCRFLQHFKCFVYSFLSCMVLMIVCYYFYFWSSIGSFF